MTKQVPGTLDPSLRCKAKTKRTFFCLRGLSVTMYGWRCVLSHPQQRCQELMCLLATVYQVSVQYVCVCREVSSYCYHVICLSVQYVCQASHKLSAFFFFFFTSCTTIDVYVYLSVSVFIRVWFCLQPQCCPNPSSWLMHPTAGGTLFFPVTSLHWSEEKTPRLHMRWCARTCGVGI